MLERGGLSVTDRGGKEAASHEPQGAAEGLLTAQQGRVPGWLSVAERLSPSRNRGTGGQNRR